MVVNPMHHTDLMSLNPSMLSISDLRERILCCGSPVPVGLLGKLQRDQREGVRKIYRRLQKQEAQKKQERRRSKSMLQLEQKLWSSGIARIAGVDEVGIGPLAGPVVAAAVVFSPGAMLPGVDDSKRVKPAARERLARRIQSEALGVGIGVVQVEEIEQLNVYNAGILAMRRAVERLPLDPEHLLLDARKIPEISIPQSSFIKGDQLSLSIAAASIIAKTYRDRLMVELGRVDPRYGFAQHKGYCTPAHMRAIEQYGPSDLHRKSFAFIQELCGEFSSLFYGLRKKLSAALTAQEIRTFQNEFGNLRSRLSPSERRKIALLLTRRRAHLQAGLVKLK